MAVALAEIGIYPIPQYVLGHFVVDFAFPEARLVLECDGVYWHNLPVQQEKDQKRNSYLRERGWTVLRLSEADINRCAPKLAQIVKDLLAESLSLIADKSSPPTGD